MADRVEFHPDLHRVLSAAAASRLGSVAEAIAQDARRLAPRGDGPKHAADTITHEPGVDERGPYERVSWAPEGFYLYFAEVGTSHQSARPFLRPAATKHR